MRKKTIKSVLDFVVSGNGYKTLISTFLSGRVKTKLPEYKEKFLALKKEYQKAMVNSQNAYKHSPRLESFKNHGYLFN